jgi:hypothetical protein
VRRLSSWCRTADLCHVSIFENKSRLCWCSDRTKQCRCQWGQAGPRQDTLRPQHLALGREQNGEYSVVSRLAADTGGKEGGTLGLYTGEGMAKKPRYGLRSSGLFCSVGWYVFADVSNSISVHMQSQTTKRQRPKRPQTALRFITLAKHCGLLQTRDRTALHTNCATHTRQILG